MEKAYEFRIVLYLLLAYVTADVSIKFGIPKKSTNIVKMTQRLKFTDNSHTS
jgi:hypothetical protein